eukprot:254831_1
MGNKITKLQQHFKPKKELFEEKVIQTAPNDSNHNMTTNEVNDLIIGFIKLNCINPKNIPNDIIYVILIHYFNWRTFNEIQIMKSDTLRLWSLLFCVQPIIIDGPVIKARNFILYLKENMSNTLAEVLFDINNKTIINASELTNMISCTSKWCVRTYKKNNAAVLDPIAHKVFVSHLSVWIIRNFGIKQKKKEYIHKIYDDDMNEITGEYEIYDLLLTPEIYAKHIVLWAQLYVENDGYDINAKENTRNIENKFINNYINKYNNKLNEMSVQIEILKCEKLRLLSLIFCYREGCRFRKFLGESTENMDHPIIQSTNQMFVSSSNNCFQIYNGMVDIAGLYYRTYHKIISPLESNKLRVSMFHLTVWILQNYGNKQNEKEQIVNSMTVSRVCSWITSYMYNNGQNIK